MVAVAYISHKLLRWLGPLLLLVGLGANLGLLGIPFFRLLLLGQAAGYGLALIAPWLRRMPILGVAASALRYFFVLNAALLFGFVQFAMGVARPFWTTTPRQVEVEGSPERHGAPVSASSS
jgi:hypothetical protein